MKQGRRITIRRPRAAAAHLDGEPVSMPDTLEVEIVPKSLRVLLPDAVERV